MGITVPKIWKKGGITVKTQLGLFEEAGVAVAEPETMTEVRLGQRSVQIAPPQKAEGSPGQADGNPERAGRQRYLYRFV
ncbi:hypothetical protein ES703_106096 [subsurface metagenome]